VLEFLDADRRRYTSTTAVCARSLAIRSAVLPSVHPNGEKPSTDIAAAPITAPLEPSPERLLALLHRWRDEAVRAGKKLNRGFLGWLRGERGHCSMARVPTIAEEDAKRPNRERECLVKDRTRLVNRVKGALARLGIRNFRPTLRNAAEHLAALHTPEGSPLPPNVAAELERDIARLGLVIGQTSKSRRLVDSD